MPSALASNKHARELAVASLRKDTLIGTFTVYLQQTKNHPDQRALDQAWVDTLVERIGDPEVLSRALHPISVILEDESSDEELLALLDKHGQHSAPEVPSNIQTLVFAGQHRLAMLSQLDLGGPEHLWWHAEVYKHKLEKDHPAEFLTMMHESNSPQLMKQSSDLELFRAVWKLKRLLQSKTINELRLTQIVVHHVIRMISTEEQLEDYSRGASDTIEGACDHPMGIIAGFLMKKHGNEANAQGYERKILQRLWANRAELHSELERCGDIKAETATQPDYQHLINKSQPWWRVMRLFKVRQLRAKFELLIPPSFGGSNEDPVDEDRQDTLSTQNGPSQRRKRGTEGSHTSLIHKRARFAAQEHGALVSEGMTRSQEQSDHEANTSQEIGEEGGDESSVRPVRNTQTGTEKRVRRNMEQALDVEPEDLPGSDTESDNGSNASTTLRRGGDRRLTRSLDQVSAAAECMTRGESRAMTELLDLIMESRRDGDMEHMVKALLQKGKRVLSKLQKLHQIEYESGHEGLASTSKVRPRAGDMGEEGDLGEEEYQGEGRESGEEELQGEGGGGEEEEEEGEGEGEDAEEEEEEDAEEEGEGEDKEEEGEEEEEEQEAEHIGW
ncbi:unnamed protein product [Rhizoctonia solani]|uniref:Uncharacterized protein n=1 Tax=Rhizoctonia solani TaxID=456999 RepID=A0A8H3B9C2_9AGAM|nr:unnamed protein product [Rhizoctonia solani]